MGAQCQPRQVPKLRSRPGSPSVTVALCAFPARAEPKCYVAALVLLSVLVALCTLPAQAGPKC
eukprot:scaffold63741_cov18-Tisochrysis_lutea.AAC.1